MRIMKKLVVIGICCLGISLTIQAQGKSQEKGKGNQEVLEERKAPGPNAKPENTGKPAETARPQQSGKPESGEKPGNRPQPAQLDRPGAPKQPNQTGRPEHAGKPAQTGNPNESHPGGGHAYGRDKGDMSGREFGQQRAAEARARHQEVKPTNRIELDQQRVILRERNTTLSTDLDRRIEESRRRLEQMQREGRIKATDFDEKIKALEQISERKLTVDMKLK
jgi:hypothetical protein